MELSKFFYDIHAGLVDVRTMGRAVEREPKATATMVEVKNNVVPFRKRSPVVEFRVPEDTA